MVPAAYSSAAGSRQGGPGSAINDEKPNAAGHEELTNPAVRGHLRARARATYVPYAKVLGGKSWSLTGTRPPIIWCAVPAAHPTGRMTDLPSWGLRVRLPPASLRGSQARLRRRTHNPEMRGF